MRILGCVVMLIACGCLEDKKDTSDAVVQADGAPLRWFKSCGNPVCGNPNVPDASPDAADACDDEVEGASCTAANASCATGDDCNTRLVCTDSDPTQQPGGCPISLASAKRDIHYVGADERAAIARDLLGVRLAAYRYRAQPAAERLGFLIDDQGDSYAVLPNGQQVDVYGFASMAVAAIQEQERRIAELERRLAKLESCP